MQNPISTFGRSLGLKLLLVCFLVILMSVPALFIGIITYERSSRAQDVTQEVSERYGGKQVVLGPVLVAPYRLVNQLGDVIERGEYIVFAEDGDVNIPKVVTDIKKRSLYKVPIYDAEPVFTARFNLVGRGAKNFGVNASVYDENTEGDPEQSSGKIVWETAKVLVGINDLRGLRDDVFLTLPDGSKRKFSPANQGEHLTRSNNQSLHKNIQKQTLRSKGNLNFMEVDVDDLISEEIRELSVNVNMRFSGSTKLSIVPFAQSTKVNISADWPHPGFTGRYAPLDHTIDENGFSASWSVPHLARGVASSGTVHSLPIQTIINDNMSVDLVNPVNPYQNVNRALKYSVLFIGIVFLAYFLFEIVVGVQVHAAQYVLIGLTQCIFYLLLLAFAEHVGFSVAFVIASVATIAATAGYAGAVFGGKQYSLQAAGVFSGVYGLLYVLMRMADFALMVGALTAFVTIAATMYLTRNVNWYAEGKKTE